MNGVEVNRVRTDFLAKYSGRVVKEIYKFSDGWFIVAPDRDANGEDFSDPYFVMLEDGRITQFIPSQDFDSYAKMTRNRIFGDD